MSGETPLQGRLDQRRAAQNAEVRAAYEAMMAEIARAGAGGQVIAEGAGFPDFMLPNAEGGLVALADLLAQGPLVVTFFRGDWCPYCRLTLEALAAALPEIEAAGGSLVAVTPETGGRALDAKLRHGARFEVLSDVDCGLGMLCGVVFRTPEVYRALLLRHGTDLAERHGNAAWWLPIPASFVLDRQGIVRWRFVSLDFTRRAEPTAIVAALRAMALPGG